MSPWRLTQIARQLNLGAIIAYPTDTIWGFGCHPLCYNSVRRIQGIKRRSANKGLILLSPKLDYLEPYIAESARLLSTALVLKPTDKPVTWLIKASNNCPNWLTGGSDRIAIRLTSIPHIALLCNTMQAPLVSTSANVSGKKTVTNSLQVHRQFRNSVDYIIEGFSTGSRQASEIRDLQTGEILRA